MKRRFGFVGNIVSGEEKIYMKSAKLATIEKKGLDKVTELYHENISTTSDIVKYCKRNRIKFYRMGNMFPFSTHPVLSHFDYLQYFANELYELGQLIKFSDTRISIHSSPYCILNSSNKETLEKSIREIHSHAKLMNVLELAPNHRAVVHVGGAQGGKIEAKKRFINSFNALKDDVKKRIVLENDDKIFSFKDVEDIYEETNVPIVIDIFHHRCHNPEKIDEVEALERACKTWAENEIPEIHFSSQDPEKAKGSHSATIDIPSLLSFLNKVNHLSFDVMLEVKDTHQSAENIIRELGDDVQN